MRGWTGRDPQERAGVYRFPRRGGWTAGPAADLVVGVVSPGARGWTDVAELVADHAAVFPRRRGGSVGSMT